MPTGQLSGRQVTASGPINCLHYKLYDSSMCSNVCGILVRKVVLASIRSP